MRPKEHDQAAPSPWPTHRKWREGGLACVVARAARQRIRFLRSLGSRAPQRRRRMSSPPWGSPGFYPMEEVVKWAHAYAGSELDPKDVLALLSTLPATCAVTRHLSLRPPPECEFRYVIGFGPASGVALGCCGQVKGAGFLVALLAAAGHMAAADPPDTDTVFLRDFTVEATHFGWKYAAFQDYEVLARCSEEAGPELLRALANSRSPRGGAIAARGIWPDAGAPDHSQFSTRIRGEPSGDSFVLSPISISAGFRRA